MSSDQTRQEVEKFRQSVLDKQKPVTEKFQKIKQIIDSPNVAPTIVNDKSSFVVATYWWGRGRLNYNTARPCGEYYSDLLKIPQNILMKELGPLLADERIQRRNPPITETVHSNVQSVNGSTIGTNIGNIANISNMDSVAPSPNLDQVPLPALQKQAEALSDIELKNDDYTTFIAPPPPSENEQAPEFELGADANLTERIYGELKDDQTEVDSAKEDINAIYIDNLIVSNPEFAKAVKRMVDTYFYNRSIDLKKDPKTFKSAQKTFTKAYYSLLRVLIRQHEDKYFQLIEVSMKKKILEFKMYEAKKRLTEAEQAYQAVQTQQANALQQTPEMIQQLSSAREEKTNVLRVLRELNEEMKISVQNRIKEVNAQLNEAYKSQGDIVITAFVSASKAFEKVFETRKPASVIDCLRAILQYKEPLLFEQMIQEWENACARVGCNYLAIEYPEFAEAGGYQLAINAKPAFIRRALELCGGRGVLYIDGDMTVDRYPVLFDMPDVDYMARGWNVDPRANDKYLHGEFSVDPYVFETSGGTMFFGNTAEAKRLLDIWFEHSAHFSNQGKADDRIISLIFNTKSLLTPMKIVQLPVEYLWLTQWYNDYIDEDHHSPTIISHPECLTSEETAAGAGASLDRNPLRYDILAKKFTNDRAEPLFESVMFPEPKYANAVRGWLDFLDTLTYKEGHDLEGEQPFSVEPWGSYGSYSKTYQANCQKYEYPLISKQLGASATFPFSYERLLVTDKSALIPKIVHQIWFGSEIPAYKQAMMASVQKAAACAGWTYRLWTSADFTEKNFPCVWIYCQKALKAGQATGQSRWAQVADLCRYELLCRFGGAYMDSNFFAAETLFDTIEIANAKGKQVFLCNEDPCGFECTTQHGAYMSNSFIASVRHHVVFRELISDAMLDSINIDRNEDSKFINRTTGPYYLRQAFDILEEDYKEIYMFEPEQVYPVPMSGSRRAETAPLKNPCIVLTADVGTQPAVAVNEQTSLLLGEHWRSQFPNAYAAYMVGLGGSWSY